jgi:glycosyltransferase involved in cell wall biosynthesis
LRICVDGAAFENSYQLGIWRYVYEVLTRLAAEAEISLWLGQPAERPVPPGVAVCQDSSRLAARRWNVLGRARRRAARWFPPRALAAADIYHATYFNGCPAPGPRRITTIHDMVAERMFWFWSEGVAEEIARKRRAILGARRCICISQATADDLRAFYPEVAGRIRVIHLGAEHLRSPESRSWPPADSAPPFALFVGQRYGYKNFWLIPQAMKEPAWPRDLALHVAGAPPAEHEAALIKALGVADRITFLGFLTEEKLREQYCRARCFIFPSLLEGFGLPVLEAQINSCPAVLSDLQVFHEVAGPAARFFDPRRAESLAEAVAAACEPEVRRALIAAGQENARRFSWDHTARDTLEVYREVMASLE